LKQVLEKVTGKPWTFDKVGTPEELRAKWKKEMKELGFKGALEWMPKMYKCTFSNNLGRQ
jgi:hypothetical protein